MNTNNTQALSDQAEHLVQDARSIYRQAAATLADQKAQAMRERGMAALDEAVARYDRLQELLAEEEKAAAGTVNGFINDNPWRATAIAAAVGVLAGVLISRR
jgi:ElaB/YqjD/DUF883 family membrane-anchored ribosome-binding protein